MDLLLLVIKVKQLKNYSLEFLILIHKHFQENYPLNNEKYKREDFINKKEICISTEHYLSSKSLLKKK